MREHLKNIGHLAKLYRSIPETRLPAYLSYHLSFIVTSLLTTVLALLLPARIIDIVTRGGSIRTVIILAALLGLIGLVHAYLERARLFGEMLQRVAQFPEAALWLMKMPAERMEGSYGQEMANRVSMALYRGNDLGIEAYTRAFWNLLLHLLLAVTLLIISVRLSPLWFFILLVPSVLKEWTKLDYHRLRQATDQEFVKLYYERRHQEKMAFANEAAKDIRLYHLIDLFRAKQDERIERQMNLTRALRSKLLRYELVGVAIFLMRDCLTVYLLVRALKNGLAVSEFVFYLGMLPVVALHISRAFEAVFDIQGNGDAISAYLSIYKEPLYDAGSYPASLPAEPAELVFENVSYAYKSKEGEPEESKQVISNLSFSLKAGEKLALVGANGAGKTTLAKLATGLLTPDSGRITIGGVDIHEVNPRERYEYCTLVFQDLFILAASVAENVAVEERETLDRERVRWALEHAGLWPFVETLPEGIDAMLTTYVDESGVELSGGQKQKLLLARALYKGGELLILDEPSAALDPLAEAALYREYLDFAREKSSIFISHRLSSTQFCDRIFFLEDGQIVERGDHESLMARRGAYYEMFETQAKYYREEIQDEEYEAQ